MSIMQWNITRSQVGFLTRNAKALPELPNTFWCGAVKQNY